VQGGAIASPAPMFRPISRIRPGFGDFGLAGP